MKEKLLNNQGLNQNAPSASRTVIATLLLLLLLSIAGGTAAAQDSTATPSATPTPTVAEQRLDEQNRLLEKQKTNAQLKKDIREAQPQPATTPLEGKTNVDENVVIETQMVTYKAMSDVADRIGDEIYQKFPRARAIAVYDAEELENLKNYRATSPILTGRIDSLLAQYDAVFLRLSQIPEPRLTSQRNSRLTITTTREPNSITTNSVSALAEISGPIAAATIGLRTFADLLALMRSDTDIKGKSVTVEESAMVAETFRALRNRFGATVTLYYPKVVSPDVDLEGCLQGNNRVFCSSTLSALAGLYVKREEADRKLSEETFDTAFQFESLAKQKAEADDSIKALTKQIGDLKLERLHAELAKAWTPAQVATFENFIRELETARRTAESAKTAAQSQLEYFARKKDVLEQLKGINEQADQLVAGLSKADEKTGRTELANFMRAENIERVVSNDGYWLELKSISAGGNNRTRKNLFRYFSGAKLDHSGGMIVEWALYDRRGASVESNKDSSYAGYHTPKEIEGGKLQDAVADPRRPPTSSVARSGNN
jgi:hypothetical protein